MAKDSPKPVTLKLTLEDGSPVTPDHKEIDPVTGQQKAYVVLSAEERAKGFCRHVRQTYTHRTCGHNTMMSIPLAETYAVNPKFYSRTFCHHCQGHFPIDEFFWRDTGWTLGT